jgi:hypothetical protein
MKHVGITGTREGMTLEQKESLFDFFALGTLLKLHHGCCVGVDEEAHWLAYGFDIPCVGHRPANPAFEMPVADGALGFEELREPKSYLARNRDIVEESEYLIVIPKESERKPKNSRGSGTWYTYWYACQLEKPRVVIWPNGLVNLHEAKE